MRKRTVLDRLHSRIEHWKQTVLRWIDQLEDKKAGLNLKKEIEIMNIKDSKMKNRKQK